MARYLAAAQLTNPDVRVVGISLNTSNMRPDAAQTLMSTLEAEHSLPCFDPLRSDLNPAVDRLLSAAAAASAAPARQVEVSRV
jgi:uncharacterized NAD-dependent epimerase/dehydratase family protein